MAPSFLWNVSILVVMWWRRWGRTVTGRQHWCAWLINYRGSNDREVAPRGCVVGGRWLALSQRVVSPSDWQTMTWEVGGSRGSRDGGYGVFFGFLFGDAANSQPLANP